MRQSIDTLKVNEKNPRTITGQKLELLVDSVLTFPKMLTLRPIVIDDDGTVLGGNMRTRALSQILGQGFDAIKQRLMLNNDYCKKPEEEREALVKYWEDWLQDPQVEVMKASELTEDEKHRFIIEDNASFGQWDYDALANDWDNIDLNNWGVDVWTPEEGDKVGLGEDGTKKETSAALHSFKVGSVTIQMTDEEFELLSQKVDEYVETFQNTFGFVNWLCNGTDKS